MNPIVCLINCLILCQGVLFNSDNVPNWNNNRADTRNVGKEIYLTPFIDAGDDIAARKLAFVDRSNFFNMTSYAGLFSWCFFVYIFIFVYSFF